MVWWCGVVWCVMCGVVWCCVVLCVCCCCGVVWCVWCAVCRCCVQDSGGPPDSPSTGPPSIGPPSAGPPPPDPVWGRRGFTRQPENSKRAHFRVPALQKHHQNSTKRPPRERGKSAPFWAPHLSGLHPSGPHFLHKPETAKKRSGPKVVWAKSGKTWSGPKVVTFLGHLGVPKAGQKWSGPKVVWANSGRAKSGLCQKWYPARPEPREPEDFEPGTTRDGWQHEAASHVEEAFRAESPPPRTCDSRKALMRSQGGPGDGLALSTCPVNRLTTFTSQLFRVVLLRRLHLPLPLTVRNCWCGFPLDSRGRAACVRARGLGGTFWAVQNAAAWICREAGGRVTTNVLVRDLDLAAPHVDDARRLEVVVDGLPLFGRAQLAVDTTLVRAGGVLLNMTGWPPKLHVSGRREPILNLWGPTAEPTWWSWPSNGFHFGMCCGSGRGVHHVGAVGSSRL